MLLLFYTISICFNLLTYLQLLSSSFLIAFQMFYLGSFHLGLKNILYTFFWYGSIDVKLFQFLFAKNLFWLSKIPLPDIKSWVDGFCLFYFVFVVVILSAKQRYKSTVTWLPCWYWKISYQWNYSFSKSNRYIIFVALIFFYFFYLLTVMTCIFYCVCPPLYSFSFNIQIYVFYHFWNFLAIISLYIDSEHFFSSIMVLQLDLLVLLNLSLNLYKFF